MREHEWIASTSEAFQSGTEPNPINWEHRMPNTYSTRLQSATGLLLAMSCCTSPGGGQFASYPLDQTDGITGDASNHDAGTTDAFVPEPLALPTKCSIKDKGCVSDCMDNQCAGLEQACDDVSECQQVSSCVKNKCHWRAYDCIGKCIYKTYSTKAGKAYLAMINCAADKCVLQACGDGFCLGKETPLSCPTDCRAGQPGPGSCAQRCGTYTSGASCQCDKVCDAVGDCCSDEGTVCDVPDVVLVSVSGHSITGLFTGEASSKNYLRFGGDAVPAIRAKLESWGVQVKEFGFIDSFYDWDDGSDGDIDRFGFLSLIQRLEWIAKYWVAQAKHPAKVIVVAHSHGAVWAHLAAMVVPQLKIDYLISLDGVCHAWPFYHRYDVVKYVNKYGNVFGVPVWDPCDQWEVPGFTKLRDAEDIVPNNVVTNLEVRATQMDGVPNDDNSNLRLDGGKTGIKTFSDNDINHSEAHEPGSAAMDWVLAQLPSNGW